MIVSLSLHYSDLIDKVENEFNINGVPFTYTELRKLAIFIVGDEVHESFIEKVSKISDKIEVLSLKDLFKLSNSAFLSHKPIKINNNFITKEFFTIIAGPCTIETDNSLYETAEFLSNKGVKFLRGGAYKPRKSPYTFQGLGKLGINMLKEASQKYNMNIVTELLDIKGLDDAIKNSDIIQVGARNMHNYPLLRALGKTDKTILLKRGLSASIDEFLLAADYILAGGNEKVILCERGIKTFENRYKSTLDLTAVSIIKRLSHLPIFVDPSHAAGDRNIVSDLAKAALAVGADGLLIEVHSNPDCAICDGPQSLTLTQFGDLYDDLTQLTEFFNKKLN